MVSLTQTIWQGCSEALLAAAEQNRREATTLDTVPVPSVLDYSHSGQVMEQAVGHLRESVPNGQKQRTEAAFAALRISVDLQAQWLRAKGYEV